MKYICKESFCVERYDDDGWTTDTYMTVEEGEVYEVREDWHRIAGSYDSIRLENNRNWLELQQETVNQYFEPVEE